MPFKKIFIILSLLLSVNLHAQHTESWQVSLPNGVLKGSLLMPKDTTDVVVLIIAGSGPTDRNGNSPMGSNNSIKLLAEGLANNNIASLRIDKRGVGASKMKNFTEKDISFDDFINDAVRWIDTLKQSKRFNKIWVLGHSQGALVGMVVARKAKANGFISLAGAGTRIDKIVKKQLSKSVAPIKKEAYKIIDSLVVGKKTKEVSPFLFALFRPSIQGFWISWMKYNPQDEIRKLDMPILIINGTTDLQVDVEQAKLLSKAKPGATLKLIPEMNHILKKVSSDRLKNLATYSNPDLPLHPELIPTLSAFILQN